LEKVLKEVQGKESKKTIDKRKLLALAAVAAAGLAIKPFAEEAHAATGENLIIGKTDNEAGIGHMTGLITHAEDRNWGFRVDDDTTGVAIQGCSNGGGIGVAGAGERHGVHGGSEHGEAIDGHSVYGTGVIGHTDEKGGPGVMGWTSNPNGVGVVGGGGEKGTGVRGQSTGGIGVHAFSENGTALKVDEKSDFNGKIGDPLIIGQDQWAEEGKKTELNGKVDSWTLNITNGGQGGAICGGTLGGIAIAGYAHNGTSIHGNSSNGIGVNGCSDYSTGVLAESSNGIALEVRGKSRFSTVGNGIIPRLRKTFTVSVASKLLTSKSHVSVTLTSDPTVLGGDAAISWIQRDPANNRFTINLTKAVGKDTTFTYFIVEP